MVPLIKILDFVNITCEKIMNTEDLAELRQYADGIKEIEIVNNKGKQNIVVDFDVFMHKFLYKY